MMYDVIEKNNIECNNLNTSETIKNLHKSFDSGITPENGVYSSTENNTLDSTLAGTIGLLSGERSALTQADIFQTVKGMYNGTDIDGNKCLGLNEISQWKVNENYKYSNIKQHAGYTAEVISTAKENMIAKADGTGTVTYRVDDLPYSIRQQTGDRFAIKNDQYADKIRVKADGSYETVQTKFVGKDASECFSKLKSSKYDKYVESGKVDKIEISKDFYDKIKNEHIPNERTKLQKQLDRLNSKGETEKAASVESKIERLNKLDSKLEKSVVSSEEAIYATEHPKLYSAKMAAGRANQAGLKSAKEAAAITLAVSSAENIYQYANGEISGTEAVTNVAKDTAISGGIAYGTGAISSLTGSSVPGAVISLGVASYDDVKDYVNGDISKSELAYDLGRNTASVVGATVGGVAGSAAVPVVGSFVGGMAGSYVATQAYDMGAELISDNMDTIVEFSSNAIEQVGDTAVKIADSVGDALADVQEKAVEIKDNAVEALGDAKDAAVDLTNDAVDKLGNLKDGIMSKFGK